MKFDILNLLKKDIKYLHLCVAVREEHVLLIDEIANDQDLTRAEVVSVILDDVLPEVKEQVTAIKEVLGY